MISKRFRVKRYTISGEDRWMVYDDAEKQAREEGFDDRQTAQYSADDLNRWWSRIVQNDANRNEPS